MKRFWILILLPLMLAADTPKKATPPQAILDALAKVQQDKQDSDASAAAAKIAQDSLTAAIQAKTVADAAMQADQLAFLQIWSQLYGPIAPTPAPTPPPTPDPTPVPVPVPVVPTKLRTVVFYDTSGADTESQREMRTATAAGSLRAWLQANCLAAADGTIDARFWAAGMDSTALADSASRFKPLVDAAGGKAAIVAQAGEGGPVKVLDFPADAATAIAALSKIANPAGRLVISNANWRQYVNLPDHGTGYIKSTRPNNLPKFRSVYPLVPRSQWPALVKQGAGTWLGDLIRAAKIPAKDQDGLGYCWVYASTECVESIRALQGQPYVNLAPESVGGPLTGWRNEGGNGLDALTQLTTTGVCAASFQNSANSLSYRKWGTGWQADCANHKITASWAAIDDGDFDAVFTAALFRLPVSIGLDWWGHQVEITGPVVFSDGTYGVEFRNSWGEDWPNAGDGGWSTLTESKATPDGSFACVSVGTSDKAFTSPADRVRERSEVVRRLIAVYAAKPVEAKPAAIRWQSTCPTCPNYRAPLFQNAQ